MWQTDRGFARGGSSKTNRIVRYRSPLIPRLRRDARPRSGIHHFFRLEIGLIHMHLAKRAAAAAIMTVMLSACGGGGGGSSTTGGPPPNAPSVSGDMLAYQANRGWNYQGTAFGGRAVTFSVYADPSSGGNDTFVLFGGIGTAANAFGGTKLALALLQNSGGGYNAASYVLYNADGSTYSQVRFWAPRRWCLQRSRKARRFRRIPVLPRSFRQVEMVPGSSACPTPATGATVAYPFQGQNYTVSYVPGCGITQYTGNNHEVITLVSVGSYPQLGTQSTRRLDSLTVFDTVTSAAHILAGHTKWQPFACP